MLNLKSVYAALIVFYVGCPMLGQAQPVASRIIGKVSDSSGGVIPGANITLNPGNRNVASDIEGRYVLEGVQAGSYTVTISFAGFTTATVSVSVTGGQDSSADATLKPAGTPQQITVSAPVVEADAQAIADTRSADNIISILPAQEIVALPNYNVAEAIGRLPGVSLERDEGEGKYVDIRGTEPRLTNTTIDGINVPSPEGGVRQVKLDTIPSDLVASVQVNTTLQANMDADGIGGSVDLKTKTAGEAPSLSVYGIGGGSTIQGGTPVGQFGATAGKRFGKQKKLGVIFGYTYDYNGRGIDDIEPTPDAVVNPNGSLTPHFDEIDLRDYRYSRTRWGLGGSLDYRLSDNSNLYLRGLYSDFKDYGDKWVYSVTDGGAPGFSESARRPDFGIATVTVGGDHQFSNRWVHWDFAFARSRQLASAGNPGAKFKTTGALANSTGCLYDAAATTNIYLPQFSSNCYTAGPDDVFNTSLYNLKSITYSAGQTAQLNLSGSAAMGQHYRLGSISATLELGAKLRNEHKFDNSYQNEYDPNTGIPMTTFQVADPNPNYYDNKEPFGPVTSWAKITGFLAANPGMFALSSTFGGNSTNFDLIERVTAGYLMNTFDMGRFRLIAGVRFEATDVNTVSFNTVNNTLSALDGGSYIDVLPSASLRYRIDSNSDIRLVYSRALSRPDPQDLSSAVTLDTTTNPFTYSIGNPALKAEHANNYDFLYEYYLKPFGQIAAGYFYKDLTDPIIAATTHPTSGQYAGYIVQEPGNAGSAWITGFEASYQQPLRFLPGPLKGFGINANYLYTTSQANGIPGRSDHPALLRQSPNIYNIIPSYDRGRVSIRVAMQYNGASIYQYNFQDGAEFGVRGPNGDNYLFSHFQLDTEASIHVTRSITAVVYGQNLTNEPFGFYNGSIQFMNQREFYKPTYAGGFRWTPKFER